MKQEWPLNGKSLAHSPLGKIQQHIQHTQSRDGLETSVWLATNTTMILLCRALTEFSQQLSSDTKSVTNQKKSAEFFAKKSNQYQKLISSMKVE